MMKLDDGIKIAQIAKVREKISNGEQEFDNVDDAMENIDQETSKASEISEISEPSEGSGEME